jgi:glycosyltransferase involved in cell wall biosynthesis
VRSVVSALRAERYFAQKGTGAAKRLFLRMVKPDLTLVQDHTARYLFVQAGYSVADLPNGVDIERFRPAAPEVKVALRVKYGFDPEARIVLHVGHLQTERNLGALRSLPPAGVQVLVAGSVYMGTDESLIARLRKQKLQVLCGYQPRIEELYMLADCYVFPPELGNSLTTPLSVLEAMACNLPIVTTRFPGLVQAFEENGCFCFVDDASQIPPSVQKLLDERDPPVTREMVLPYSWTSVACRLQEYYEGLLGL